MEKTELILGLAQLLQNNGTNSFVSKLPSDNCAKNQVTPDNKELLDYLNSRLECAFIDKSKAKGYLLLPYSKNQWKVFVVDKNNKPYAQLDDYNDAIPVNGVDYKKSFVVKKIEVTAREKAS